MVDMMVSSSARILVGLPLDPELGAELLSWIISVAAHPKDTITALHVLDGKDEKKHDSVTQMRQAKGFVISMLGEFAELCQSKQVNLEAKVVRSSSVGKGLAEEAVLLQANLVVIGGGRNQSQRSSLKTAKYCFNHAPEGCLVIVMRRGHGPPCSNINSIQSTGFDLANSTKSSRENETRKAHNAGQELLSSKIKRNNSYRKNSLAERIYDKPSPVAVLEGPEAGASRYSVEDDCFSHDDDGSNDSSYLSPPNSNHEFSHTISLKARSKRWKNLSGLILKLPFFLSPSLDNASNETKKSKSSREIQQPSWRCFSYEEISRATNNFHADKMIGKGGYSEVYRGDLSDGQIVAVKRLAKDNSDGAKEKNFLSELGVIGHVHHPNTSNLIGCCIEHGLHLVFNFSSRGSLASALHGQNREYLTWPVRYNIAVGIARGLHYLHKYCKRRIIHRDIKASNVLLGPDFEPQISDFGLAKWLPKQWTHHSVIPIEGTFGYLAPEYFMHGIVDEKTDVYAFGILLLEIITGRRPIELSKQSLLVWAKPLIESGNIAELTDPNLEGNYDMVQLKRLVLIASFCIRQSSIWRPTMTEVLELLVDECDSALARTRWMSEHEDDELENSTSEINSQILTSPDYEDDY